MYRRSLIPFCKLYPFCFIFLLSFPAVAQIQSQPHPALTLCKAGKHKETIAALSIAVKTKEFKTSGEMWNCLGLARYSDADDKNARKAFETATKLEPMNAVFKVNLAQILLMNRKIDPAQSQLRKALIIDPQNPGALYLLGISDAWESKFDSALESADQLIQYHPADSRGYVLKSDVLVAKLGEKVTSGTEPKKEADLLRQAVEVLASGRTQVRDNAGSKTITSELEVKTVFYDYFSRDKSASIATPSATEPGVTPLAVTYKQKASYTDRARQANVQGSIRIAVLFGAGGKVEHIMILKRLGHGLDEQAMAAARNIRFDPQRKDGKPVSVVRIVEYTFNIY